MVNLNRSGYLIFGFLVLSYNYMALRAVFMDHFVWVLICPAFSLFICIQVKLKKFLKQRLDRLIIYYLIYGVLITAIGLLIGQQKVKIIQNFVHMYLPALAYIIARYYCSFSFQNVLKIMNGLVLLAAFLVIDIFIEYYVIENISTSFFPWINLGMRKVADLRISLGNYQNLVNPIAFLSVMGGSKTVALVIASLFCFLFPFLVMKSPNVSSRLLIFNKLYLFFLMIALLVVSFILPSLASTLSLIFVTFILFCYNASTKNIKPLIIVAFFFVFLLIFYRDFFILQFYKRTAYMATSPNETQLAYIFNLYNTYAYYSEAQLLAYVFGGDIFPNALPDGHKSELTLLLMPLRYGIIWATLISLILLNIIKYFRLLIKKDHPNHLFRPLGMSFMGFFLVYMTNLHYPSFNLHGNIELFFIMAATLCTAYEFFYKDYISNKIEIF